MFSRKHIGVVAALVAVGLVAAGVLVVGDEQPVAPTVTQPAPRGLDDQGDLRLIRQTPTRIVLGWTPELTGFGYLFSGDGTVIARTPDPARDQATFRNIYASYEVAAIDKGDTGTYSPLAGTLTMTVIAETANTITFGWTPQAEYGYLFSGDGDVISRTYDPDRSYAKFNKSYTDYEVAVLVKGVTGTYPEAAPPAGTANLWIDTNGGTCSRSGSPIEWPNNGTECDTLDEAYDAASCGNPGTGDTVLIKGGTYGTQDVTGTKTCSATWTIGAAHGVTCTSCVDMAVAPGETVNLGRTETNTNYLIIEKGDGTDLNVDGWTICSAPGANLIMRDADLSYRWEVNCATDGPFDNLALVGGTVGGFDLTEATTTLAVYVNTCYNGGDPEGDCNEQNVDTYGTDIIVDGVYFYDLVTPNPGDHSGVVRIDSGWDGVTIRNSSFYDNIDVTTSSIQTTNLGTGGIDPLNVTLANNYCGDQGSANRCFNFNSALVNCTNYRVLYNTMVNTNMYTFGCTNETGSVMAGNLAPWAVGTDCFGTHSKNYWYGTGNSGCGTDTNTVGDPGLGGADGFTLQAGAAALQKGEQTYCLALDHNGDTRPQPGATNCDAGGNERNE